MTKRLLILLLFATSNSALASFRESNVRYLAPRDFFNLMEQKFPVVAGPQAIPDPIGVECWAVGKTNENVLGAVKPLTGKTARALPGAQFISWLTGCMSKVVSAQFRALRARPAEDPLWNRYFPSAILQKFQDKDSSTDPFGPLYSKNWSELSVEMQDTFIASAVHELLGPEPVLLEMGFANGSQSLVGEIRRAKFMSEASLSIASAAEKIYLAISLREEFYKY